MPRLPAVDELPWGEVLNDYLSVAHRSDGFLRMDVQDLAALRAFDVERASTGTQVHVNGVRGGWFSYDLNASAADDGWSVIAPTLGAGRWLRIRTTEYLPELFGAVGGGADDTAALVAMAAAANAAPANGAVSVVINGVHRTTKTIQFTRPGLLISGCGKLIKGGPISVDAYSDTDSYEAASLITLAGAGQRLVGLTFDNDGIDGQTNGYGRAVAIASHDVSVESVRVTGFINGIESGWNSTGFLNWSGVELHRGRVAFCHVTNCRPHHDAANTSVGGPIRLYSSNNIVVGCHVQASDTYVNLELLHGIKLEGLLDRHTGDSAVNDNGGAIIGNTVTGPFQHSIYTEGMDGVAIIGNTVRRTGREGIVFQGSDTTIVGNIIDVGGYKDVNDAAGIRSVNGKNYRIEQNIICPWRNVDGDAAGHHGIITGTSNGHGTISNNTISMQASVRTKYRITGASGSLTTGSGVNAAITDGKDIFRVVDSLVGDELTLGQGTGWFKTGSTITQTATGWSATVAEWIEPTDVRLERGIDCSSLSTRIEGNTIDEVAQFGIYLRYGKNLRVRRNFVSGYTSTGIMVQDYNGDIAIEHNEVGEALGASGSGIYVFTISTSNPLVTIKGNRVVRNATGIRLGNFTIGTGRVVVADNDMLGNTTAVTNPRLSEVTWRNNSGYKTMARGQATIAGGGTSIALAHGLVSTPAHILLTARGNVGALWPTSLGGTNFTINCASAPGGDTLVDWQAEVTQPA